MAVTAAIDHVDHIRPRANSTALGGATATQVRLEDPWFLFPVALGVLAWLGLYLREARLAALLPIRS